MGGRSIGGSGSPEATPGHPAPAGLDQPALSTAGRPGPAKLRHLLAGPIIFAVLLLAPLDGLAFETRGAMDLLVWMAWWWPAFGVA